MKKIRCNFFGRTKSRDTFLSDFRNTVCNFLEREAQEDKELHLYLKEIIKNMYDHNNGYGFALLEKISNEEIVIVIGNTATRNSTSKTQDRVNFGIGLQTIQSAIHREWPGISVTQDPKIPYHYSITYHFSLKG